jgi:hypothetical protein
VEHQLLAGSVAVGFNRFDAETDAPGDFLVGMADGGEAQDLCPRGRSMCRLQSLKAHRGRAKLADPFRAEIFQIGIDIDPAAQDRSDRLRDLLARRSFEDIAANAYSQRLLT